MYKYVRNDIEDEYGFLGLQDKILQIMSYVDNLCKENDIDYCLMGGSALGAKRHGGFIPWDDDLDIFMTPDNYDKFTCVFNEKGDKDLFYLQEWGHYDNMVTISKVRLNNTEYIEEILNDWDIHHGIYIDIFILHNCPNNIFQQIHQFFWAKYVITKGLSIRGYNRRRGLIGLLLKIAKLFPNGFLVKHGLKQVYKYRNKKSKYFCNFMGKAVFKNAIYKKEWFIPTKYINFETIELKVPVNLHEFLKERFGDYMIPPTKERIKWEQHASYWNINTNSNNKNTYLDERKLI